MRITRGLRVVVAGHALLLAGVLAMQIHATREVRADAQRLAGIAERMRTANAASARLTELLHTLDTYDITGDARFTAVSTSSDSTARGTLEVARTVYGLTAAGIVELGDPANPGREPEPGRDLAALLVPAREAMSNGQYDIAAGALDEVLRRDPLMPEARRLLGV